MSYVVGVDIGGTFTDCVVIDESGGLTVGKALSTPADFSLGALDALNNAAANLGMADEEALIRSTTHFFHACTIGDNTLITRAGAETGLLTTRGFGDALLMMRGNITEGLTEAEAAHQSALDKPEPLILSPMIGEISERVDYKGGVLIRMDEKQAETVIDELVAKGVESLAISLLWSISNDIHERRLAEILRRKYPSLFVSLSSEVAPFLGEYERTATTVFNAYIGPKIGSYLMNLQMVLKSKGLTRDPLIMQAYGGVLGIEDTCKNAVGTIESGPASGVVGSQFLGELLGQSNILATDMGGTTFKVSVIRDGVIERDYRPVILRHNILSTKIWVESIGAGGGSIAWIEPETGLLKVGPQGAGAKPGPVSYDVGGTAPTVTDSDVVLGYLNPEYFLGGRMTLNKAKAENIIHEKIAEPLGISNVEAASGIHRIANSHMSDLIRKATVERGHDPREFVLFAFGGAGPVHANRYASELGIKRVFIPLTASVHGATGLISSDVVYEYGKSDHVLVPADIKRVNENFAALSEKAIRDLGKAGFDRDKITLKKSIDMRYRYQVHELNVPFPPDIADLTTRHLEEFYVAYDALYEKAFGKGSGYREAGMEMLTFRLTAVGKLPKPQIRREPLGRSEPERALKGTRPVYFTEYQDFTPTRIYDFANMQPGIEIPGPAIIETPVTTIVVNPHDLAMMDEFRNVRIRIGSQ